MDPATATADINCTAELLFRSSAAWLLLAYNVYSCICAFMYLCICILRLATACVQLLTSKCMAAANERWPGNNLNTMV